MCGERDPSRFSALTPICAQTSGVGQEDIRISSDGTRDFQVIQIRPTNTTTKTAKCSK